ncbi:MAG: hypothetical protein R2792_09760 [Saprospiraceae bacterium]
MLLLLAFTSCQKNLPEEIPLPTQVCVQTYHHHQPIPDATVYIKYNADSFPGNDKTADYYDAVFYTNSDAKGCIQSVPEGRHWIVAFGYDSLYFPHDVFGSIQVEVDLTHQAKIDTVLYITE